MESQKKYEIQDEVLKETQEMAMECRSRLETLDMDAAVLAKQQLDIEHRIEELREPLESPGAIERTVERLGLLQERDGIAEQLKEMDVHREKLNDLSKRLRVSLEWQEELRQEQTLTRDLDVDLDFEF